jgi:hypothetical protein
MVKLIRNALAMLCLLAAACLASSCAPPLLANEPIEGQETAVNMVWRELWGQTRKPPAIFWVQGAALNCDGGQGFVTEAGKCAGGSTQETPTLTGSVYQVLVALPDPFVRVSETALTHELRHAFLTWTIGHPVEDFGPDEAYGGKVGEAMQLLGEAGL